MTNPIIMQMQIDLQKAKKDSQEHELKDNIMFITHTDVSKVIEALKAMGKE